MIIPMIAPMLIGFTSPEVPGMIVGRLPRESVVVPVFDDDGEDRGDASSEMMPAFSEVWPSIPPELSAWLCRSAEASSSGALDMLNRSDESLTILINTSEATEAVDTKLLRSSARLSSASILLWEGITTSETIVLAIAGITRMGVWI